MAGELVTVRGQVSFRRPVSKKLIFYDVVLLDGSEEKKWVEWLVKEGPDELSRQEVRDLKDLIRLGDIVDATGVMEDASGHLLHCRSASIHLAWRDASPTLSFVPVPAPFHGKQQKDKQQPAASAEQHPQHAQQGQQGPAAGGGAEGESAPASERGALLSWSGEEPSEQASTSTSGICRFYATTGRCPRGDACKYIHVHISKTPQLRRRYMDERKAERWANAQQFGMLHDDGAEAKSHRASKFCRFLVETYGLDFLNSGTGVVDVAGGRGAVTFELLTAHGVRCTLVEPRPHRPTRLQKKALKSGGVLPDGWTMPQITGMFVPEVWREGPHAQALAGCSLVVGMHPDQATDSILDFAQECGKPFAMVPCCVFGKLFPHRRFTNAQGERVPVESYPDLVAYVRERAGAAGRHKYLDFDGANQAVFSVPVPEGGGD